MDDFSKWVEVNKALWTRVYDEVITPSFEAEWKKREDAHRRTLAQNEENKHILSNHTNDLIIKNARLEAENEQLKTQLQARTKHSTASNVQDDEPKPSDTVAINIQDEDLASKYQDLLKQYHDLSQKVKYLERKNQAVMQKNKAMKDNVRAWQEYADRQADRQKLKAELKVGSGHPIVSTPQRPEEQSPHMPSSPRSITTFRSGTSPAEPHRSPMTSVPPGPLKRDGVTTSALEQSDVDQIPQHNEVSRRSVTPKPFGTNAVLEEGPQDPRSRFVQPDSEQLTESMMNRRHNSYVQPGCPNSSQTTVEENSITRRSSHLASNALDDEDVPQFVSERSLKRKRGPQSRLEVYAERSSDGTPVRPFQVKDEQMSSPPLPQFLMRKDTIDLDDLTSNALQTPHRSRYRSSIQSTGTNLSYQHRANSAPFSQNSGSDRPSYLPATTAPAVADRHDLLDQDLVAEARAFSEPTRNAISNEVLQPIDTNARPRNRVEPLPKRTERADIGKGSAYSAEEDERMPVSNITRSRPSSIFEEIPHLRAEMHTPTSSEMKIKAEPGVSAPRSEIRDRIPTTLTRLRNTETAKQSAVGDKARNDRRPRWTLHTPETRTRVHQTPAKITKSEPRLRSKPVAELKLVDFKPNPGYNQGYSYAFSETIRKRGDRLCLPGCTNPQCCGSTFRKLAEAQGPLSSSQEAALLEDYLGEAYDNSSLTQMAEDEREELVLQARTRKLAKETGKHRQAYEGRRTPPGFWRVDFPTTQEQQDDRERAKQQEREQIHDRWLEAQRKGGRWIFRDE